MKKAKELEKWESSVHYYVDTIHANARHPRARMVAIRLVDIYIYTHQSTLAIHPWTKIFVWESISLKWVIEIQPCRLKVVHPGRLNPTSIRGVGSKSSMEIKFYPWIPPYSCGYQLNKTSSPSYYMFNFIYMHVYIYITINV